MLCDRASRPLVSRDEHRPKAVLVPLILIALTVAAIGASLFGLGQRYWPTSAPSPRVAPTEATDEVPARRSSESSEGQGAPVREGSLSIKNRSGRSGYFYVPEAQGRSLPVLVLFHGQGGNGEGITPLFRGLAQTRGFAIVAPDSGFVPEAGFYTWYAKSRSGETSPDTPHILASIHELITRAASLRPPVSLRQDGWLAVGHSAGGSSAAALATDDLRFSHFGVLHGGVFPDGFGSNLPDGWFSTGEEDALRTPLHVRTQARTAARVIGDTRVRVKVFPGGHAVSPAEAQALIDFWLGAP